MKKVYSTRRPDFLYFIPDFIAVLLIALFLLSFKGRTVDMKLHGAAVNISDLSVINEVEITIKGTASYKLF